MFTNSLDVRGFGQQLQWIHKRAAGVCMMFTALSSLVVGCSQTTEDAGRLKKMIQTGDLAGVSNLISARPSLITADLGSHRDDRLQPLMLAVNLSQEEISKLLIAKGAPVNATNNVGWTPLQDAVAIQNTRLVQLLLRNGADVRIRDLSGRTPLEWARESKVPDSVIAILEGGEATATNR